MACGETTSICQRAKAERGEGGATSVHILGVHFGKHRVQSGSLMLVLFDIAVVLNTFA